MRVVYFIAAALAILMMTALVIAPAQWVAGMFSLRAKAESSWPKRAARSGTDQQWW